MSGNFNLTAGMLSGGGMLPPGMLNPNTSVPDVSSADSRTAAPIIAEYFSEKHHRDMLESLFQLRKSRELCDVTIVVNDRHIFAHRAVLAACSPYFRAMFTGDLSESKQAEITLKDIDETAVEDLIDFAYAGKISIEERNVQTLLPAACLLQMQEIQDNCCDFLKKQLDPSNCLGIRSFADAYSCRDLLKAANRFAQLNFLEVVLSEEFLLLPVAQLVDLLASDELNISKEEQVYQAAISWIRHDVKERRQHVSSVLEKIRLCLVTPKFLVSVVSAESLFKSEENCREMIDEAKNYLLLPTERSAMQGPHTKPRRPIVRGEMLYAVGGWCSGDAINSVEKYDPQLNEWKLIAPMSKRRCGVGVAVLNDLLYAVGGHDGQAYLNSVERYDPQTNQWSDKVAPTSSCRTSVGVAVMDGHLYAVGGQDGVSCLNLVEKYDPQADRWAKVASMSTKRLGVAVAVLNGYLYACGGSDGSNPLNTVERYDPRTNRWQTVTPMGTRRKHLGCAVLNGHLYAVGGRDDHMELSSCERYDPKTCTWDPVIAMSSRRSGVGLAIVNGLMFAVGGFDGNYYLRSAEVFDPETVVWRPCATMNYRRLGGGVAVVGTFGTGKTPLGDQQKIGGAVDKLNNLNIKQDSD
ncbi:kelch-like protein diablo [Paramacrobiotus metropolitanus]|uniref:kelch-like protein diablo n=1 Tax=Paramacrobiotus metropolitanus TaxID=2943436 RepID=UPI002445C5A4|nr:kelch-like protein diablo [Paramacrobiotus metropolitanus]XP_055327886.1 kelch-like protein diablo [Paramacrobiotus metropolitanus]XP_055327887.1 kelch-like protein diablo [Paramacrobiotus metropolitanus]XP_055327889.1 kelch-like protein diablo [Paramacrobiotus metropolitanus]